MSSESTFLKKDTKSFINDINFIQLNDIPDKAIVICNQAGTIITANVEFCELIGSTLNKIVNNYSIAPELFLNIGVLKDSFSFNELLNGKINVCELHFIKANKTNVFMEVKAKKITDKNVAIFFKDISHQRNLHISLQDLTNKLQILNEDKSRFISVLAHDLKSPFNSILGFIELLKENYRDYDIDVIEKYISYIETASKNTYNLLEDTLEWIRSESGNLKVYNGNYELNNLIFGVIENFKLNATAKNINIIFTNENKISAFCDANMIKSVLRNLLSNAIKFTNKNGEIHITLSENSKESKISIKDNGIGIPKELQSQLFRLNGVNSSRGTAKEKGTGMGLLICKEFIKRQNGKLYLTSEMGVGSTFTFTIPTIIKK